MENNFDYKNFLEINNLFDENNEVEKLLQEKEIVRFKSDFDIVGNLPNVLILDNENYDFAISVDEKYQIKLVPKIITVGMGCRKNKCFEDIFEFYHETVRNLKISLNSVEKLTSIDIKKEEMGLIRLAENENLSFITYPAKELLNVRGEFSPSGFVKSITGVDNVCERSAVIGSENGEVLLHKTAYNGMTIAAAIRTYRVKF